MAVTPPGFKLVYLDGHSPRRVRAYLESQARKLRFTLIRTEHYLSPNEARNLGLQYVESKYVVFIDNDVIVAPGWLDALIECAEETGAWVVGALYCIGEPIHQIVHMAGGESGIAEEDGKRAYYEHHHYVDKPLADALTQLHRQETDIVEFHCMLVRHDAFQQIGPLDEALLSAPEHADFCLTVREAGGSIYLEPRAVVTQLAPPPVAWSDLPFFALRWNPEWNHRSTMRFHEKWNLSDDSAYWQQLSSFLEHRSKMYYKTLGLQPLRTMLALISEGMLSSFDAAVDRLVARLLVHPAEQKRARACPPIIRHAP